MFVNTGYLEVKPGAIEQVLAILTRPDPDLVAAGCLVYEVGKDKDNANLIQVVEVWHSAEDHKKSLQLPSVRQAIAEAMPYLTGNMGGTAFESLGSPLREGK